jgi:hydrogenase nickel incorporation protein HypA/HybF
MHELALAESIVRIVEDAARRHGAARIRTVALELGALSHAEPDALAFAFEVAARGGCARGARLDIHRTPGAAQCAACGDTVPLECLGDPCPRCGGYELRVTDGDALRVRDIEID